MVSNGMWEYLYADFAIGKQGYFLLAVNDVRADRSFSLVELSDKLGEENWELVNSVSGRRVIPKNSISLNDLLKGNTSDLVDVIILSFKRPLTAERLQGRLAVRLQEQINVTNQRRAEAEQFLQYVREGGVQLVAISPNQIQVKRGRLTSESQTKLKRLEPELIEILIAENTN